MDSDSLPVGGDRTGSSPFGWIRRNPRVGATRWTPEAIGSVTNRPTPSLPHTDVGGHGRTRVDTVGHRRTRVDMSGHGWVRVTRTDPGIDYPDDVGTSRRETERNEPPWGGPTDRPRSGRVTPDSIPGSSFDETSRLFSCKDVVGPSTRYPTGPDRVRPLRARVTSVVELFGIGPGPTRSPRPLRGRYPKGPGVQVSATEERYGPDPTRDGHRSRRVTGRGRKLRTSEV